MKYSIIPDEMIEHLTLFAGGILSLFGDVTISWPVCKDPTGVDCKHKNTFMNQLIQ